MSVNTLPLSRRDAIAMIIESMASNKPASNLDSLISEVDTKVSQVLSEEKNRLLSTQIALKSGKQSSNNTPKVPMQDLDFSSSHSTPDSIVQQSTQETEKTDVTKSELSENFRGNVNSTIVKEVSKFESISETQMTHITTHDTTTVESQVTENSVLTTCKQSMTETTSKNSKGGASTRFLGLFSWRRTKSTHTETKQCTENASSPMDVDGSHESYASTDSQSISMVTHNSTENHEHSLTQAIVKERIIDAIQHSSRMEEAITILQSQQQDSSASTSTTSIRTSSIVPSTEEDEYEVALRNFFNEISLMCPELRESPPEQGETPVALEHLQVGDHIYVNRYLYQHHGIYVGRTENYEHAVIHFSPLDPTSEEKSSENCIIQETSMERFLLGAKNVYRKEYNVSYLTYLWKRKGTTNYCKPDDPDIVVERARSKIGQKGYQLHWWNCEHFSHWCKTGVSTSDQVRGVTATVGALTAASVTLAGVGVGAALMTAYLLSGKKTKNDSSKSESSE